VIRTVKIFTVPATLPGLDKPTVRKEIIEPVHNLLGKKFIRSNSRHARLIRKVQCIVLTNSIHVEWQKMYLQEFTFWKAVTFW